MEWEYKCATAQLSRNSRDNQDLEATLNKLGKDGWELVNAQYTWAGMPVIHAFFKRLLVKE